MAFACRGARHALRAGLGPAGLHGWGGGARHEGGPGPCSRAGLTLQWSHWNYPGHQAAFEICSKPGKTPGTSPGLKRNPLKSSGLWCRFGVRENRKNFPKKRLDGILHLGYIGRYLSEFLPTLLRIELATSDSGSFFLSDTIFENRIVCVSL